MQLSQRREDTGLPSIHQLEVWPTRSCFVAVSEKAKGGLPTGTRGMEVKGLSQGRHPWCSFEYCHNARSRIRMLTPAFRASLRQ
jgi:hypothetical protein